MNTKKIQKHQFEIIMLQQQLVKEYDKIQSKFFNNLTDKDKTKFNKLKETSQKKAQEKGAADTLGLGLGTAASAALYSTLVGRKCSCNN